MQLLHTVQSRKELQLNLLSGRNEVRYTGVDLKIQLPPIIIESWKLHQLLWPKDLLCIMCQVSDREKHRHIKIRLYERRSFQISLFPISQPIISTFLLSFTLTCLYVSLRWYSKHLQLTARSFI